MKIFGQRLWLLHLFAKDKLSFSRPDPHPRGAAQQPDSLQEQDEEILGSDDEEQEDPNDYCKGRSPVIIVQRCVCTGKEDAL